jgi:hypothetical protein
MSNAHTGGKAMETKTQYLEEIQALGWESIEQYEEAQKFYAAEKARAARLYGEMK